MSAIGFTGTRKGMTEPQRAAVRDLLCRRNPGWLDHGDCLGADSEAHDIATALGIKTRTHPPSDPKWRAFCSGHARSEPKDYLSRNRDIVDETDELIAAPEAFAEPLVLRGSGTWSTISYARLRNRIVTIVYPDGSLEFSP